MAPSAQPGEQLARLTPAQLEELRKLHELTGAVLDFVLTVEPEFQPQAANIRAALATAWSAQNLKGMRVASRDIRDFTRALSPAKRRDLLAYVRQATGHSLEAEETRDAAAAARILERGSIRNQREYYVLRSRLDRIAGDSAYADEEARVWALVNKFRT